MRYPLYTSFNVIVFILLGSMPVSLYGQISSAPVVVLSMDGFRWDYQDSFPTPNLHRITSEGVRVRSLIPSFPSVTFPNHYTIATGLYPNQHGIIYNQFYAPELHLTYQYNLDKMASDGRFYGGEPIWVTAQKQGVKTANFFWVGSEAEIEGQRPTYWKKYDGTSTYESRIDTVVHWLSLPAAQRPGLVMFYFDYPDHLTHSVGPFGPGVKGMVMRLDTLIGILIDKLHRLPGGGEIDLILVSDHGMEKIGNDKRIVLDQYIRKSWCKHIFGHYSFLTIDGEAGYTDSIRLKLANVAHLKIWRKEDLPQRFHFGTNNRIGELVLLADSTYSMLWSDEKVTMRGNHGYDPQNTDMHGIFYGIGPDFKKGYLAPSFGNIHIYSLLSKLLHIQPANNDGDFGQVENMLMEIH